VAHVQVAGHQQSLLHRSARFSRRSRLLAALRERPTACGRLLVRQAEFVDQPLEALRFFERIEVFALDVLDQRHHQRLPRRAHRAPAPAPRPGPASWAARKRRSPAMIS
jgi:hypothetical protein